MCAVIVISSMSAVFVLISLKCFGLVQNFCVHAGKREKGTSKVLISRTALHSLISAAVQRMMPYAQENT